MITIDVGSLEIYNPTKSEFEYFHGGLVRFEYSLKALYIWEGKWRKPFLKGELTEQELVDFYMTMAIDPIEEKFMTSGLMKQLADYIQEEHTATKFSSHQPKGNGGRVIKPKIHTAEELYAIMLSANIPLEFEHRNLNRLLTILKITNSFNEPPKKMTKEEVLKQNAELNRQRRQQMKTKG